MRTVGVLAAAGVVTDTVTAAPPGPDSTIRVVDGVRTQVLDTGGAGGGLPPVLLLHGSGPGVTAWANWRPVVPALVAAGRRVVAPDQLGFGGTATGENRQYGRAAWTAHALALLDELGVDQVDVVGNSMGGAVALALAAARPAAVRRIVLMGAMGIAMALPSGLDTVWGYTPSVENMRQLIGLFAFDQSLADGDLVQLRYQASLDPNARASWESMFPPPRQRWVDDLALSPAELTAITQPVLLVHGRDDRVVPFRSTSLPLLDTLADVRLHVFGACGHWTMIEHTREFNTAVLDFLS